MDPIDPPRKRSSEELEAENDLLRRKVAMLEEELARLRERVEELTRKGKRQAAPFSKDKPKGNPKPPGRKPGDDYGQWHCRAVPDVIDEEIDVPLDPACPSCGGKVAEVGVDEQYQTDLPQVRPICRRFTVHLGVCQGCGECVQARHPLQTSDALGAARSQIGPHAVGLAALLNKGYGLSWGKIASLFKRVFGLEVERSTFCRAAERLSNRLEPEYAALTGALRDAAVVNADETGWRIAGQGAWLWVFVAKSFTVYRIARSRGFDVIEDMLGVSYAGLLGRDGWAPYAKLTLATHQSCLAHHFARAHEILEVAVRGAARFAHAVIGLFSAALDLRDRREELTPHGFKSAVGKIEARADRLLDCDPGYEPNAKFAAHLRRQRPHLFTFLHRPEIEATNWPGEQAMRPAVVTRRNCGGGNRTARGAYTQEVLMTVIRSSWQQARDTLDLFVRVLRHPGPLRLGLVHGPAG